jgi:hypothetical protein
MNKFVFRLGRVMDLASAPVAYRATTALQQGIVSVMSIGSGEKPTEYARIQMTSNPAHGKNPP